MQLYPTRTAAHLTIASLAVAAVGVVAQRPAIVGWGGAVLVAVALARAATLVSVSRIRAAGFEMLWSGAKRVLRTARGGTLTIEAEVRNRDTLAARFVKLRAVASAALEVTIEPSEGEVAASGRLRVKVRVHAPRVGRHGIHGLALEVQGAPGLFEVPLTFANPYGIEVLPRPLASMLLSARGGRSRLSAAAGRPGRARGEGNDLRELREHQPGDPFRRIAWKASARRGRLLVREFEREERDVVVLVLDASVELWAGPLGRAPLDLAIDELAALAARHLARGDRVGLEVYASHPRTSIAPEGGPAQAVRIAHALLAATATHDADRSDLDESDVAVRVMEHLRPIDPRGLVDVRRGDLDRLAARADAMRGRAPFAAPAPEAPSARERTLRRYLASYGIDAPARLEPERRHAGDALARVLGRLARERPRPSLVHIVGAPPAAAHADAIATATRRLRRHGAAITWAFPRFDAALEPPWDPPAVVEEDGAAPPPQLGDAAPVAAEAVRIRARVADAKAEAELRPLGVRLVHPRPLERRRPIE